MPFFQVDDQLTNSRKHRELAQLALGNDLRGMAGIGLWTMAGAQCQASLSDGVVRRTDAISVLLNPDLADQLAGILVEVGLWHAPGHQCPMCPPVSPGTWVFHDWFQFGYDRASQVTVTRAKRAELKDQALINSVWARDCVDPVSAPAEANCRYCGLLVKRQDRRSPTGRRPQLDHVDPNLAIGARNIVISCGDCNRTKGNRTPEQAGLTLLPAPRSTAVSPASADAGSAAVSPQQTTPGIVSPGNADAGSIPSVGAAGTPISPANADAGMGHASPGNADAEAPRPAPWPPTPPRAAAADSPAPADAGSAAAAVGGDHARPRARPPAPEPPRPPGQRPAPGSNLDQIPINPDQAPDQTSRGIPARATQARVGQAGSGQGSGLGWGVGKGHTLESPTAANSPIAGKRRRRRGRGTPSGTPVPRTSPAQPLIHPSPPIHQPAAVHDAGHAPEVPTPGRFGSPWHGWTGPPSHVTETTCTEHQLPAPCRKCLASSGDAHV